MGKGGPGEIESLPRTVRDDLDDVRIAQERNASVVVVNVIEVPLEQSLDDPLEQEESLAAETLAEAQALADENDVPMRGYSVRTRSIGAAVVEQAREVGADLIVIGSGARWRRHSRFFSPTVEYVLRKAPCEVMIVSFPENAFEGLPEPAPEETSPSEAD